jgi:hypothetical protein
MASSSHRKLCFFAHVQRPQGSERDLVTPRKENRPKARYPSLGPFWGQGGVEFLAWHQDQGAKSNKLAPELDPLVDVGWVFITPITMVYEC